MGSIEGLILSSAFTDICYLASVCNYTVVCRSVFRWHDMNTISLGILGESGYYIQVEYVETSTIDTLIKDITAMTFF